MPERPKGIRRNPDNPPIFKGPHSKEARDSISASLSGKKKGPHSEGHTDNISDGMRRYWQRRRQREREQKNNPPPTP